MYEYGSILTPSTKPDQARPNFQVNNTEDNDQPEPKILSRQTINSGLADSLASDSLILDFPDINNLDEEFWTINDSLLGQQQLTSFIMGNEFSNLENYDFHH